MDPDEPNLEPSGMTNRGPSTKAIKVISSIIITPGYKQTQKLSSHQRLNTLITDTLSSASVKERNPQYNRVSGSSKDLNKSLNLSVAATAVSSSDLSQYSRSRGQSFMTGAETAVKGLNKSLNLSGGATGVLASVPGSRGQSLITGGATAGKDLNKSLNLSGGATAVLASVPGSRGHSLITGAATAVKDLNKSLNLSGGATAVLAIPGSRGQSLLTVTEDNVDDGQLHSKKKKTSHEDNEENRKLDIILEELKQIKKREAKTNSKVNFIVRKLMDDDSEWKSFTFPMDDEAEYERFKVCLLNKRFTDKLVTTLKNKIFMSKKIVSELVETMFTPELLIIFNKCGLKGKDSFETSNINEIFLAVSGMNPQLYNSDLAKVMNKMHMRYTRRYGKYNPSS